MLKFNSHRLHQTSDLGDTSQNKKLAAGASLAGTMTPEQAQASVTKPQDGILKRHRRCFT